MSRNKAANQRQEYLDAYKASGENVSQWCKRNGMHRTTMYRWLRQDANSKAVTAKPSIKKSDAQAAETAQIKWLPVIKKNEVEGGGNKRTEKNQTEAEAALNAPAKAEIRVQIGGFTIITPDGFKRDTLETVCQALQTIC